MHELLNKCIFLLHVFNLTTAQISTVYWTSWDTDFGPVINVFCKGSTSVYHRWVFADKLLAQDGQLIDADPSRYSVQVGYTNLYDRHEYGSLLVIKNALKEDGGLYECQLEYSGEYYSNYEPYWQYSQISVEVHDYLPSLSFPKCHISPSNTLNDKSDATFTCTAGESSSSLNLLLTLQHQN